MSLPPLTHLQFLVLGILRDGTQLGSVIRDELATHGVRKSGPAFYQLMARLEDGGMVSGRYESKEIEGQRVRLRAYRLTADGQRAWDASRDFYLSTIREFDPDRGLADA